ncbi:MAG: class I SAM-dependent methyltransferase [Pyrinomonadaceae bacterium]|nr:class I SAM-dependent methyltransferase [Pyrinomonadaceae bacterium]
MSEGSASGLVCRICGNHSGNRLHQAREMFLGTRDCFAYIECAACGTLQIQQVPDLKPYYPRNYYSFLPASQTREGSPKTARWLVTGRLGSFLRRRAADYYCRRQRAANYRDLMGHLVAENMDRLLVGFPEYLKNTGLDLSLNRGSKILDVGSGAGETLLNLSAFGFTHLLGVDTFLESDISYGDGVRVLRAEIPELDQPFDLIIASHSLEHVPEPRKTLEQIHRLLPKGQYAIIRMPVLAFAWETYGIDWVQLDAPRHLFLFTCESFSSLAEEAGFAIAEVVFDSTAFQFWASEQYRRDIPLMNERSYFVNPNRSIFSADQIDDFSRQAAGLNQRREGDQAVFYLRRK